MINLKYKCKHLSVWKKILDKRATHSIIWNNRSTL